MFYNKYLTSYCSLLPNQLLVFTVTKICFVHEIFCWIQIIAMNSMPLFPVLSAVASSNWCWMFKIDWLWEFCKVTTSTHNIKCYYTIWFNPKFTIVNNLDQPSLHNLKSVIAYIFFKSVEPITCISLGC